MPFVPVPNTADLVLRFLWNGQQVVSTLGFQKASAWDAATLSDLANSMAAWWVADLKPITSNVMSLYEVSATDLTTATSAAFDYPVSPIEIGGSMVNSVPNNCALTVTFKTANRGRSFRGRNYVPGMPGTFLTNNLIDAGYVEDVLAAYDRIRTEIAPDTGTTWVVISRYSGVDAEGHPIPRTTGLATPITAVSTFDHNVDSQRRRLPGRGD